MPSGRPAGTGASDDGWRNRAGARRDAPPERVAGVDAHERADGDRRGQHEAVDPVAGVRDARRVGRPVDGDRDAGDGLRAEDADRDGRDPARGVGLAGDLEQHRVRDEDGRVDVRPDSPRVERVRDPRPAVARRRGSRVVVDLVDVVRPGRERLGVAVLARGERHLARSARRNVAVRVGPPVVDRARRHRARNERADDCLPGHLEVWQKAERDRERLSLKPTRRCERQKDKGEKAAEMVHESSGHT